MLEADSNPEPVKFSFEAAAGGGSAPQPPIAEAIAVVRIPAADRNRRWQGVRRSITGDGTPMKDPEDALVSAG